MSFHVMGTGSALPARQVTNDELSQFLDTDDAWITERTGIKSRPVCTTETLDELSVAASRQALERAGVAPEQLDLIICTTMSAEHATPAQACVVQGAIGATCPAFDVNAACAGFVFALDVADGYFARGRAQRILIVSAEKVTRVSDWTDRATCVLFGDGAAAAVLGAGGESPLYTHLPTQSSLEAIHVPTPGGNSPFDERKYEGPSFLTMRGREVFKFAVTHICSELELMSAETGIALESIDHFVFHQANKRIIDAGVERLGIDPAKVIVTIDHTANVSSACIPLSLDTLATTGQLKDGELVALFGFGAGLVTGCSLIVWQPGGPTQLS
ncbi:MAG: ketoacyl-ACP synthase III [Coriobacteriia bacterium]|nr:ketoacyl-ACP synthase III [Coriobacteriia bacterium]